MEKQRYIEMPLHIKAEDVNEEGIFKGYGSTFGGAPDSYGDVVVEGAFSESVKNGGKVISASLRIK